MVYTLFDLFLLENKYDNVALGNFDGLHKGHQKVLKNLIAQDGNNLVITFKFPNFDNKILTDEEKIDEIKTFVKQKSDILFIDLQGENSKISKEDFIKFLQKLCVKNIYVGKDFKFGYKASGNISDLSKVFNLNIVDFVISNDQKVSSSIIRENLILGHIKKVNDDLGKNYFIHGEVIYGNQIGRTIDFPTINIRPEKLLPKKGVYLTKVYIDNDVYNGITNVGIKPTIGKSDMVVETHIFNEFKEEFYGKYVKVEFLDFIRQEKKFNSIEELKIQISKDINKVKGMI